MKNKTENNGILGETKDNDLLNESNLSEINLSILSSLSESTMARDNFDLNSNYNIINNRNYSSFISKDQYACTNCELPPEILFDTDDEKYIKIKCQKHGLKLILIKDFLQKMSKNTYHFYKCDFCRKSCQKNYTQIFKYCYHCKKILCPKCLSNHESYKSHKKIVYSNEINIRCENHFGEKFMLYCYDCDKNICKICSEEDHRNHFFIYLKELNPSNEYIQKINSDITKLKQELNKIIKKAEFIKNTIILKELIVSAYKKYENNYHHIINVSNLYKNYINPVSKENMNSNVSTPKDLETPKEDNKKELLITKFDLVFKEIGKKPINYLNTINKINKKIISKTLINDNKLKSEEIFLSTIKTSKGNNNSKFNKKFNININKNSEQIILNHLKLDDNDFNELCSFNLPSLSKLSISENNITNLEPLSKIKSKTLEELYLDNNSISNIEPLKKIYISYLNHIILYSNKISSIDCLSGLSFSGLTQLNLYNNKVSNIDALSKIYMPKLQILHLGFNKIKNIDVLEKVYFPELISLNLNRNEISNIKSLENANFPKLEKLDFFDNNISNIEVMSKVNYPCLKELNFWINNIQDIKPLSEADFPFLEKLNLSNNNILDLKNFNKMKFDALNELNIQYNKIDMNDVNNIKILNEIQKKFAIIKY